MRIRIEVYRAILSFVVITALVILCSISPITLSTYAATLSEIEPNDSLAAAQLVSTIGQENPISATIGSANDQDWFSFDATENKNYTVEIYNAERSFDAGGRNGPCSGEDNVRIGVSITIYSASGTRITQRCNSYGAGNVNNILEFKAGITSRYYIQVASLNASVSGFYFLRILPQGGEPFATWNSETFEPNNTVNTAYSISVGSTNFVTTSITERNSSFSTNRADADWFRFEAVQGQEYVVEVFSADRSLINAGGRGGLCFSEDNVRIGLGIILLNPSRTELSRRCNPYAAGNSHNFLQFKADIAGTYYFLIQPLSEFVSGNYNVRVLPKYDTAAAVWNTSSLEPNNYPTHSYALFTGSANSVTSAIEERSNGYSTFAADVDWYHITGKAGIKYTIDLFNVASTLSAGTFSREGACYAEPIRRGLGLLVYDNNTVLQVIRCGGAVGSELHNRIEYTPQSDGIFYVLVQPNDGLVYGRYSIRVTTPGDQQKVYLPLLKR